jgi:hypothetical protein
MSIVGLFLSRLLNAIRPNLISKIHTANRGYLHMENITNYLKGCVALGLKRVELFDTIDLYDEKNKYLVSSVLNDSISESFVCIDDHKLYNNIVLLLIRLSKIQVNNDLI